MDFSKVKNKFLICLCCFVIIFPFYLITFTYASEENVDNNVIIVDNVLLSVNSNSLASSDGFVSYFLPLEKGYTYTVVLSTNSDSIRTGYCDSTEVGSTVYDFVFTAKNVTVTINSDTHNYFYYGFGDLASNVEVSYTITRVSNNQMVSSVTGLVDNVGIGQIWNIFDISINYIVVVVLFAFGCYIIFRIIKKVSRGKEGL